MTHKLITKLSLTGWDETVAANEPFRLAKEFPFLELGVLASEQLFLDEFKPRYPMRPYFDALVYHHQAQPEVPMSVHLCGKFVDDLIAGNFSFVEFFRTSLASFQRIQINAGSAEQTAAVNRGAMLEALEPFRESHQFVWQANDTNAELAAELCSLAAWDFVPLWDESRGRGERPAQRHKPFAPAVCAENGYAGGISLTTLPDDLQAIEAMLSREHRVWLCIESGLREDSNPVNFSLDKATLCAMAFSGGDAELEPAEEPPTEEPVEEPPTEEPPTP